MLVNRWRRPEAVPPAGAPAAGFHASLPGYAPTPVRELPAVAAGLGVRSVSVKDESNRLGLPAFKILGASWAVERALDARPDVHTLVAASAGNHGRAVAHAAAQRSLRCRVFLPERSARERRAAIAGEGADVVVVAGDYEEAVARAAAEATRDGVIEIADVGTSGPAAWVLEGYATLFAEAAEQADLDLILVPVGVGSLAAAAVRFAVPRGIAVVGVEPATAACLTASLAAGEPVTVPTPGTTMAGLDCARVSAAAWPTLRDGIHGMVTVEDFEVHEAMRELASAGLQIGDCGAAPLAALRRLGLDAAAESLRDVVGFGSSTRVLLLATEGVTDAGGFRRTVSSAIIRARKPG